MKVLACIPARYGSTRFPAKVLAKDTGKFLIQHTYERACAAKLPEKVIIAADDKRIVAAAESFGADCIMTSPDCPSGTDRIAEAIQKLSACPERPVVSTVEPSRRAERYPLSANDIVVNIQADEPEIDPANIDKVAQLLIDAQNSELKTQNYYGMATLAADFQNAAQISDPNIVKVIVTSNEPRATSHESRTTSHESRATGHEPARAIYFSRSVIPYDRQHGGVGEKANYLRHLGIYAYRKDFLLKITKLPQTPLEKIEKLEQLRAIENGFSILVAKVEHTCDGIDTSDQYAEFVKRYKKGI